MLRVKSAFAGFAFRRLFGSFALLTGVEGVPGLLVPAAQYGKGLFVIGEEPAQERDGDGTGDDLSCDFCKIVPTDFAGKLKTSLAITTFHDKPNVDKTPFQKKGVIDFRTIFLKT